MALSTLYTLSIQGLQ